MLGTAVGFVLSVVVILGAEADSHLYVVLLGLVIFAAVYAARAGGVLAGQAAFTVMVVVLFSLLAPSDLDPGRWYGCRTSSPARWWAWPSA